MTADPFPSKINHQFSAMTEYIAFGKYLLEIICSSGYIMLERLKLTPTEKNKKLSKIFLLFLYRVYQKMLLKMNKMKISLYLSSLFKL